jgi:EAL domain-containing protein (putative c-di-GMP-specific phosphodiesterase class I)
MIGMEALIRWRHPQRGLLGPAAFLSHAEQGRLLLKLNRFVLRSAVDQLNRWRAAGTPMPTIHVNMNPRLLGSRDWMGELLTLIEREGVPPGGLVIELVESLTRSVEEITPNLQRLRQAGVRIALDDFGVGHSSLGRLCSMPIDILKIDRSFVRSHGADHKEAAIVSAILALAEGLDLPVIAEGIETRDTLLWLQRLGCGGGQGYLLSRPMPADAVLPWVRTWRETHTLGKGPDLLRQASLA